MITSIELEQVQKRPTGRAEADAPLSFEVFRDFTGLDRLRTAWDEAVLRAGGSVYMTYDWVRVWWDFYGGTKELRLFVFSADERLSRLCPSTSTRSAGDRVSALPIVGSNIPPRCSVPRYGLYRPRFREGARSLFFQDKLSVEPRARAEFDAANKGLQSPAINARFWRHELSQGVHSVYYRRQI